MIQNVNANDHTFKPGFFYWIKHFSICFFRWKKYIVLTIPLLFIIWYALISKYIGIKPKVDSNVLIGTYQKNEYSFFPEYLENESVSFSFINSRCFLNKIVDSLMLNFSLPNTCRSDVLSYVYLDSSAKIGNYSFNVDNLSEHHYTVSVCKNNFGNDKIIKSGKLVDTNTVIVPGAAIVFTKAYLAKPFDFKFAIISKEDAVKELGRNIEIRYIPQREHLNQIVVEIVLTGSDPELTSKTINLIADAYIEENIRFLKEKIHRTLDVLETQLQTATYQLEKSDDSVKVFKIKNPDIVLNNNIYDIVSGLPVMEEDIFEKNRKLQQASDLKRRMVSLNEESNAQLTIETLHFLGNQDISGAIGLQQYFTYLLDQKFALETNEYASGHRLVRENNQKINLVNKKTLALLVNYIEFKKKDLTNLNFQKKDAKKHLYQLPEKEMQYAELLRQQQINSELYSQILNSYNQAKIACQAILSDMYIMDYSIPVIPRTDIKRLMIYLTSGILLSLLLSLGPAFVYDLFDKKPHTKDDLERFFSFPILEAIPLIPDYQNSSCNINNSSFLKFDTSQHSKEYFLHKTYDKIYAEINSVLETKNSNSLLITSYACEDDCAAIAANLAILAAYKHKMTLLIDSDIRHGMLFDHFNSPKMPGFSDLLHNELPLSQFDFFETIRHTNFPNLHLLCSGTTHKNPTRILLNTKLNELIKMSEVNYKMVIVNSPPLSMVPDSYLLSREIQSCVFVIKAGRTDSTKLNGLISEYPYLKEKIIGIILVDSVDKTTNMRKVFLKYLNTGSTNKIHSMST